MSAQRLTVAVSGAGVFVEARWYRGVDPSLRVRRADGLFVLWRLPTGMDDMAETLTEPIATEEVAEGDGLAKAYDPRAIEAGVYDRWDAAGYFRPRERPDRAPFVIVMPPPNVTGELHIGHALFVTI